HLDHSALHPFPTRRSSDLGIPGIEDIGMTTNALLLKKHGKKLYDAGLKRLNISLDALDSELFGQINDRGIGTSRILENIDYAISLGYDIKVNMVVQKGLNDHQIVPMARHFKDTPVTLRFIEFMDVGNDNGWNFEKVVSKEEILDMLREEFTLDPLEPAYFGEVAKVYKHRDTDS